LYQFVLLLFNRIIETQVKQGKGVFISKDGEICEGWWKNNNQHGKGRNIFLTGNTYEGEYKDDTKNGHGKFTFLSGLTY